MDSPGAFSSSSAEMRRRFARLPLPGPADEPADSPPSSLPLWLLLSSSEPLPLSWP